MAEYVGHFHDSFIGLTGPEEKIADAARNFRVYFAKVNNKESPEDYLMDHSSVIYVMGRRGEYVTHFSFGTSVEKIAERLASLL